MFDIADVPFSGVSDEEKQLYTGVDEETGWYHAYKLRQSWVFNTLPHDIFSFDLSHPSISTLVSVTSLSLLTVIHLACLTIPESHLS